MKFLGLLLALEDLCLFRGNYRRDCPHCTPHSTHPGARLPRDL